MKILKVLLFLILNALITLIWLLPTCDDFNSAIHLPAIWIFPILIVLFGFVISWLLTFVKKANKADTLLIGQLISFSAAIIFCSIEFVSDWQHDKQYGNMEWNRANRNNTFYPEDSVYQIKAFDALEKNFTDKNSFRITDLFSDNQYTIINSMATKIHISWFGYFKSNNPNLLLCAKYRTYNDTIEIVYYNSIATSNQDFMTRKNKNDSILKFANHIFDSTK